jgi:hypothetical protein
MCIVNGDQNSQGDVADTKTWENKAKIIREENTEGLTYSVYIELKSVRKKVSALTSN